MAKEMVEYDDIYIIDTLSVTHLIELLASYARKLINSGLQADEIAKQCEELKSKIKIYAVLTPLSIFIKAAD